MAPIVSFQAGRRIQIAEEGSRRVSSRLGLGSFVWHAGESQEAWGLA